MEHPFALPQTLTSEQVKEVSGATASGRQTTASQDNLVDKYRKYIRPPFATTQAIGEEGGSFSEKADF